MGVGGWGKVMLRRAFAYKKAAALSFLRKILEFMHATFSSFKETILCERERATTKKRKKNTFLLFKTQNEMEECRERVEWERERERECKSTLFVKEKKR